MNESALYKQLGVLTKDKSKWEENILNNNGGGDWKEHGVTAEQVYKRQSKTRNK